MPRVLVVGCGNPDAADDAVGVLAVRGARPALEAIGGTRVVEGAIGPDLTNLLAETDAALIVDAIRTPGEGRHPGTVVRAEAGPNGVAAEVAGSLSSHGFGVAEAVGLAVVLGTAPRVVFLGVEVLEVGVGRPMSQAVRDRLPELERRIVREAADLARA